MAQFYTLEEAAGVLGMNPDELKSKAQSREIRAFLDSGSWRFRVADVDELARRRGMGSDPDLSLSDLDLMTPGGNSLSDSVEIDLSEFQLGVTTPAESAMRGTTPLQRVSDDDILLDDLSLPVVPPSNSSSTIIGMESLGKRPSDSDVRLVPNSSKGSSDSDVRLAPSGTPEPNLKRSESDVTLVSDDSGMIPGITELFKTASKTGEQGSSQEVKAKRKAATGSSDFELTPGSSSGESDGSSGVIEALQPDSGSDFELNPESGSDFELSALDGSGDFDVTPVGIKPSDSDVTAAEPAASGINLGRPSDSGINLQSVGGLGLGEHDSIELAPLEEDDAKPAPPKAPRKEKEKIDLSATALPIKAGKDLFEDTDFEVDALDSGQVDDRTMQIDAASDFELEDDSDSGSQVFALDEDDVDQNAATAMAPAVRDDDDEGMGEASVDSGSDELEDWGADVGSAAAGAAVGAAAASAVVASPALTSSAPAADWGGLWVGLLGFATVLSLILALVSMDLVRNQYEWRNDTPASGMVRAIAEAVGS